MAKEEKVKKSDMVTVYGSGLSRHIPEGKEISVHKIVAEKLIASEKAYSAKPDAGKGKGKKAE